MKVSNTAGGTHSPQAFQAAQEMDALQATRHGLFGRIFGKKKKKKKNHVVDKAPAKGDGDVIDCEAPPAIVKPRGSLVIGAPRKGDKKTDHIIRLPPVTLRYQAPPTTIQVHYNVPGKHFQVQVPDLVVPGERVVTIERIVHVEPDTYTPYDGELIDQRTEPEYRCEDVVHHGAGKGGTRKPNDDSSSSASSGDGGGGKAPMAPRKGDYASSSSASSSSVVSQGKAPEKGPGESPEKAPEKGSYKAPAESSITSSEDVGKAPYPPNKAPHASDKPEGYDPERAGPAFPRRYQSIYNG